MATESRICSLALVTMLAEILDGFFHWLDLGGVLPEYSFLAMGCFVVSSGEDSDSSELDRNGDGCFEGVRGMNLIWFILSLNRTPVEVFIFDISLTIPSHESNRIFISMI